MRWFWLVTLVATVAQAREGIRENASWRDGRFELGPRLTHLTLVDSASEATLPMGGIGGYLRYRFTRRFGVEAAVDAVISDELGGAQQGEVVRATAPATLAGMIYLFPDDRLQLYFLLGFGRVAHQIEYERLDLRVHHASAAGVVGFGAQYRAEGLRFDLSLRSLGWREDADDMKVEGGGRGVADYQPKLATRDIEGGMFTLGVNWGW